MQRIDHVDDNGLLSQYRPGYSLPQAFYTSDEVFEADMSRLFHRHWLLAGHVTQVANPGDYFLFQVGKDSLIIVKDDRGELQALHNTCRHRGSTICQQESGTIGKFICPYHQWAYERDGRLTGARGMGPDFDKSGYGLHKAHVLVVEGFIYICLNDTPPDFDGLQRALPGYVRGHDLQRTKICYLRDYEINANWKLLFENNRECYHCAYGHPEFFKANYDLGMPGDTRQNAEYDRKMKQMQALWAEHGLEAGPLNFPNNAPYRCARVPLRDGYITESIDGQPVAPLLGTLTTREAGSLRIITLPNSWCHVNSDNANFTILIPLGPQRTWARIAWLVHEDAVEGVDYDPERVAAFWKITTEQDWKLCEDTQKGVNSSRYQPGPLSSITETGVDFFDAWYINELMSGYQRASSHSRPLLRKTVERAR